MGDLQNDEGGCDESRGSPAKKGKGPRGQEAGTITTDPKEVDAMVRESYGEIHQGNVTDQEETVRRYLGEYDKYMFKMPGA